MINWRNKYPAKFTLPHFGLLFLFLAVTLILSVATYWMFFLEPQINEYSRTQSNLIAQSQSWVISDELDRNDISLQRLKDRMDEILILADKDTEIPYIHGITVEVDNSNPKLSYVVRGNINCITCFIVKIPLYAKSNHEVLGLATFYSNNDLFNFIRNNIRSKIVISLIFVMIFIAFAWFIIWKQINKTREKDKNLSAIFDTVSFPMLISNTSLDELIYFNHAAKNTFNFTNESFINWKPVKLFSESCEFSSAEWLTKKEIITFECEIININNQKIWTQATITPVIYNETPSCIISLVNISEIKKSQYDAEIASRAKSEFLSTMSHEIRTPMNGIIGMLNLFKRTSLTDIQKNYLDTINVSSEQLLFLLNDILDISKIESGKLTLEHVYFNLLDICNDCIHLIENKASSKCVEVYLDVPPGLTSHFMGDDIRLRQIIINLLGNAVKFTEKGCITLKIIELNKCEDSVELMFSIIDTGIGIPEKNLKFLFEKFTQQDSSTSRKYGGTGLGLAISKKLVEAMDGHIGVKNNSDKGATFYFSISLSTAPNSCIVNKPDKSSANVIISGLSILMAEDNEINSYAAKALLEADGHHVTVASNGKEAVDAVVNSNKIFDVILMDIHMPEVDGIEACKRIRALTDTEKHSIPIIALTANIMQDEKVKCIEAGMNSFITKPFLPEKLNAELSAVIRCK